MKFILRSSAQIIYLVIVSILLGISPLSAARDRVQVVNNNVVADNGYPLRGDAPRLGSNNQWHGAQNKNFWIRARDQYHLNSIRIFCYRPSDCDERDQYYSIPQTLQYLDQCVQYAQELGMYAVIDYHPVPCGAFCTEDAVDWWTAVASRYKDMTHVVYELSNEPTFYVQNLIEWHRNYMKQLYELVRSLAPNTHIICWSIGSMTDAQLFIDHLKLVPEIDYSNASVGFHPYHGTDAEEVIKLRQQYPVISTEISPLGYPYPGKIYLDQTRWHEDNAISWFWLDGMAENPENTGNARVHPDSVWWPADPGCVGGKAAVMTPVITPAGGNFIDQVLVVLNTNTPDAIIYYTLDGTAPTQSATAYTKSFTLQSSTTVKARGFKDGMDPSFIASATFTKVIKEPYPGPNAHAIPGKIEAEDFDKGGEGISYHDTETQNQGGAYRTNEAVDIQTTSDAGGGYNVGWTQSGEWLEYAVEVSSSAQYTLEVRHAGESNSKIRVLFNNIDKTGDLTLPSTEEWQQWQTTTSKSFNLAAGKQAMRVELGGNCNLNWFEIKKVGPSHVMNGHSSLQRVALDLSLNNKGGCIYTISGRLLIESKMHQARLRKHLSYCKRAPSPNGFYIVKLLGEQKSFSKKIVLLQ